MPGNTKFMSLAGLMGLARFLAKWSFFGGLIVLVCASLTPGVVSAHFVPQDYALYFGQNDRFDNYLAYGLLMLLAGIGFTQLRPILLAFLGLLTLAILLEAAQFFVPGRVPNVTDILANIFGTLYGAILWWLLRQSKDPFLRD